MDLTAPATQADFVVLMQRIGDVEVKLDRLGNEIVDRLETQSKEFMDYMDRKTEETKHHFAVVAENLHKNMLGAHKDKIGVLDDRSNDHEQRIAVMEKQLAI